MGQKSGGSGKCAGVVQFPDERQAHLNGHVCAGWPGVYKVAYGKGNGDVFGVVELDDGTAFLRAVIPLPLNGSQYLELGDLRYCRVL